MRWRGLKPSAALLGLICLLLPCGSALPAAAQQYGREQVEFAAQDWDATFFDPNGTFDTSIPTPESVLGFPIGRRPVRYEEMRRYLEVLDRTTERLQLRSHGTTHEGRDLLHAAIGTATRIAALDGIQSAMQRFADPRRDEANGIPLDLPLVAWLGYSIHGDELSGCDAAVQLAYQLVAGTGERTVDIRENVLTLIDPLQNPDGRERYLAQIQSVTGMVPNPDNQSLQHRGFWPWGRANHYLFDLNRDWFTLTQPESRGRVTAISSWNPQLVIDGHEMGWDDTYLFSPPREPFNPNLPATIHSWWEVFARDQAAEFDRAGWSFYTREWNEEFFPGYGSSWSMYLGAIGILYEQASTDGGVVRQSDGSYLTYREAVLHQFRSSMANLETASRNREEILRDYRSGRRQAIQAGRTGPVRAFVFLPGETPGRARRFVHSLLQQGVEVHRAVDELVVQDAHDCWGASWKRRSLPAGSLVVLMDQPLYPLLRNLLDFHVAMPDSFLREERDYLERQKGSRLYEVTAWSLPLSNNLESLWTSRPLRGRVERLSSPQTLQSSFPETRPDYAYLIDGSPDETMLAVGWLLERGVNVHVALDAFHLQGRAFSRGTLVLRVNANPEDLSETLRRLALETGVATFATDSGRADEGPDLGGGRFAGLIPPRIGLLTGSPISFVSYGSLWHLLDHDLRVRTSSLDVQNLGSLDLEKYNVLVMPHVYGGAESYARALGPRGISKLDTWVEAGGTLIAVGSGAAFLADSTRSLSKVRLRRQSLEAHAPSMAAAPLPETALMEALGDAPGNPATVVLPLLGPGARAYVEQVRPRGVQLPLARTSPNPQPAAATGVADPDLDHLRRADARLRRFHPQGALVRLDLDLDHWLTFGLPARVPALASNDLALIARAPVRVLARFAQADSLHLSGLLWPEAADRLARTAAMTREQRGKGQVILFSGDPTYRRATPGAERLILNAILLGPGLGISRPAPW